MPKLPSRKFISPAFTGDRISGKEDNVANEKLAKTKGKALPSRSLSDSQYEDLFREVIKKPAYTDKKNPLCTEDDGGKEHCVVIPEPNAALSPDEEADGTEHDLGIIHGSKSTSTTPDNCRIDNSVLPPLKKKKPLSRIRKYKHKLNPKKLNFDDPDLMGKPEKVPIPKETVTLSNSSTKKPKISKNPPNPGKPERSEKHGSPQKTFLNKTKPSKSNGKIGNDGNSMCSEKRFVSPKFQNQQIAGDRAVGVHKQEKIKSQIAKTISSNSQQTGSSIGSPSPSKTTPKFSQLGSQASSLSGSQILSPRSRLVKLQKKRNVGLWVQCSKKNCSKWRYLASIRDPTEVPDNWQCYMNNDKQFASCSTPEKGPTPVEEEDLIHNLYTAGSLVWARLSGYPWWPAIVDDDPDVEQYYWVNEDCDIPTHYSVAFFDEKPVTRAWLTPGALTKYSVPDKKIKNKMIVHGIDHSQRIKVAISQADEASKLPIDERLKRFSFVARYKGPIGKKRDFPDSPDRKKAKDGAKKGKLQKPDFNKSLEVVEEVNKVLSQLTSESEEDDEMGKSEESGSEEDPQTDIRKSLEAVEEVNKVLNQLTSESESEEGIDDASPKSGGRMLSPHLGNSQRKENSNTAERNGASSSGRPSDRNGRKGSKIKKQKMSTAKDAAKSKCPKTTSGRTKSNQNKEASGEGKVAAVERGRERAKGEAKAQTKGAKDEESEVDDCPSDRPEEDDSEVPKGGDRGDGERSAGVTSSGSPRADDIEVDSDIETVVGGKEESPQKCSDGEEGDSEEDKEIREILSVPTPGSGVGRASADLFERRDEVDRVSDGSQQSADFDFEE